MSGRLILINKQPGIHQVGVRETWNRHFDKCVLSSTGTKATNECQNEKLCAGLKTGIYGAIHNVQSICDTNTSTENLVFLLVDEKTRSTKSIALECCGWFTIYGCPELVFKILSSLVIACLF